MANKLKLIYHHRTRGDGAEGVHIHEMINAFEEIGHEVTLCCPAAAKREPGLRDGMTGTPAAETKGFSGWLRMAKRQFFEIAYNVISFARLWRMIGHAKPDAIYERYSCYHMAGVFAARLRRVPIFLEVNSTYAGRFPRRALAFPRIAKWMEEYATRKATCVAVVSGPLKECVMDRGVSQDKIVVTPNAINESKTRNHLQNDVRAQVRKELGLLENQVVIGFVGSLRRWHGVDMLVKLIPKILEQASNSAFLIVGAGELESDIQALASDASIGSRVRATGGVPHHRALELVQAMDVGLMPHSNNWGSPMKILEYMAFAKLTISPRLPPIEEIVEEQETGLLFDPRNESEFQTCMLESCDNHELRIRLGQNAQRYVLSDRRWTDNARMVLDHLR